MPIELPRLCSYIPNIETSPLHPWAAMAPWELVNSIEHVIHTLIAGLSPAAFEIDNGIAIHRDARVESGAVLKGPLILGAHCFVAAGAYLRGGNWLASGCTIGPGAELKSSLVFAGTKLAHFNFVGDSILGEDVNLEAGSILCNYRNERADKEIRVRVGMQLYGTGCQKFGALVGDHSRIGANAVLAPGALLAQGSIIPRCSLRDDEALG